MEMEMLFILRVEDRKGSRDGDNRKSEEKMGGKNKLRNRKEKIEDNQKSGACDVQWKREKRRSRVKTEPEDRDRTRGEGRQEGHRAEGQEHAGRAPDDRRGWVLCRSRVQ